MRAPRTGIDAFQEDPNYKRVSRVPIVRVRLRALSSRPLSSH